MCPTPLNRRMDVDKETPEHREMRRVAFFAVVSISFYLCIYYIPVFIFTSLYCLQKIRSLLSFCTISTSLGESRIFQVKLFCAFITFIRSGHLNSGRDCICSHPTHARLVRSVLPVPSHSGDRLLQGILYFSISIAN